MLRVRAVDDRLAEIGGHFVAGHAGRAGWRPVARAGNVGRVELIGDADHCRVRVRPALHLHAVQLHLQSSDSTCSTARQAVHDAPAMQVGIAAALLGRGVEVAVRADAGGENETPSGERQAHPALSQLSVAMMAGDMALVEPGEAGGEVFAEAFLVRRRPRIRVLADPPRHAAEQREFLRVHGAGSGQEERGENGRRAATRDTSHGGSQQRLSTSMTFLSESARKGHVRVPFIIETRSYQRSLEFMQAR